MIPVIRAFTWLLSRISRPLTTCRLSVSWALPDVALADDPVNLVPLNVAVFATASVVLMLPEALFTLPRGVIPGSADEGWMRTCRTEGCQYVGRRRGQARTYSSASRALDDLATLLVHDTSLQKASQKAVQEAAKGTPEGHHNNPLNSIAERPAFIAEG